MSHGDRGQLPESEMIRRLAGVLDRARIGWSLCLLDGDQSSKLAQLTDDLQAEPSPTGDGKKLASGFSFWGIEATLAWERACHDPFYPVMRKGMESFAQRFADIRAGLGDGPFHYVSLGPGDGEKDHHILRDLGRDRVLSYVPVDISADMLQLAVYKPSRDRTLSRSRILPVQLDFSEQRSLDEFRILLRELVRGEPVLFSLLGNTMSNFPDDGRLLEILRDLLEPQDRFLLEVATTQRVDQAAADAAAAEYQRSRAFRDFITSALLHYTDLTIEMRNLKFHGEVEGTRAIIIKVLYHNIDSGEIKVTLPDRSRVLFPEGDTIRLNLIRKYSRERLSSVVKDCGFSELAIGQSDFVTDRTRPRFGMDLRLLSRTDREAPDLGIGTAIFPDTQR